jgi:hypothetical protein
MSEFDETRVAGAQRRPRRPAADPYAPTEALGQGAPGRSEGLSFRRRDRRLPALAAVLTALLAVVAVAYALLSSGGEPKPAAGPAAHAPARAKAPAHPKPAHHPGGRHDTENAATGSASGAGPGARSAGSGGGAAGGSGGSDGAAGASGRASSGSGGGSHGSAAVPNMIGPTPSVRSVEGQRLLKESPDCRNAPPPPPGYNGPVQC